MCCLFSLLFRFVLTIIKGMENMEAVNIRFPALACTSASTSYRMTVNMELPASELIILMQLPWKFWTAEVSVQKIFAPFRKHTRISFFSSIKLTSLSPKEQRKVCCDFIMSMVYHYFYVIWLFLLKIFGWVYHTMTITEKCKTSNLFLPTFYAVDIDPKIPTFWWFTFFQLIVNFVENPIRPCMQISWKTCTGFYHQNWHRWLHNALVQVTSLHLLHL